MKQSTRSLRSEHRSFSAQHCEITIRRDCYRGNAICFRGNAIRARAAFGLEHFEGEKVYV